MTFYEFLIIGHICVFGIWFGTDVATFTLSRAVLNPAIEVPSRAALAGGMTSIEVIARLCLPTMLALGLSLSIESGLLAISTSWILAIWIVTAGWVALIWAVHSRSGASELDSKLATTDLILRSVICVALWVAGIVSLVSGDGPFLGDWLGVKVMLFALIMSTGITIRFRLKPFAAAFGNLVSTGSTPETEAALSSSLKRAQPLVGIIWLSLLAATVLGVTKTLPW